MPALVHYTNPANLAPLDAATINIAQKSIDFAAYSLTEPAVIQAIKLRAQAQIPVRIYLDRSEIEAEARGNPLMPTCPLSQLFNVPGIAIKVKRSLVLMHLKSYCVDSLTLRDGSANFSPQGECEQDNSVQMIQDPGEVAAFMAKFETMWARPDNLTVAEAVAHSAVTPASLLHRR
jgi:phosphatidylserine/phosphatidylglycerophosphate/cardiolipin synthase-like enzyme